MLDSTRLLVAIAYPFEAQFGRFEKELRDLFEEFERAIDLASKQTQSQQSKVLATIRSRVFGEDEHSKKSIIEARCRAVEEERMKILDAFSTYNHRKWYSQIRKECLPGTSVWICECETFQMWLVGPVVALWCSGRCQCLLPRAYAQLTPNDSGLGEISHQVGIFVALVLHGIFVLKQHKRLCNCLHNGDANPQR